MFNDLGHKTPVPDWAARVAGLIVVVLGSISFLYAIVQDSIEGATAAAAFTGVALYLLFGERPPRQPLSPP